MFKSRSLYWRIGLGFIFFLAVTLGLQAALFLWVAGETEGGMPDRMRNDFAELPGISDVRGRDGHVDALGLQRGDRRLRLRSRTPATEQHDVPRSHVGEPAGADQTEAASPGTTIVSTQSEAA